MASIGESLDWKYISACIRSPNGLQQRCSMVFEVIHSTINIAIKWKTWPREILRGLKLHMLFELLWVLIISGKASSASAYSSSTRLQWGLSIGHRVGNSGMNSEVECFCCAIDVIVVCKLLTSIGWVVWKMKRPLEVDRSTLSATLNSSGGLHWDWRVI